MGLCLGAPSFLSHWPAASQLGSRAAWENPRVSRQDCRDPGEPIGDGPCRTAPQEENWGSSRLSALTQGPRKGF